MDGSDSPARNVPDAVADLILVHHLQINRLTGFIIKLNQHGFTTNCLLSYVCMTVSTLCQRLFFEVKTADKNNSKKELTVRSIRGTLVVLMEVMKRMTMKSEMKNLSGGSGFKVPWNPLSDDALPFQQLVLVVPSLRNL